jgi:hypothetical protein
MRTTSTSPGRRGAAFDLTGGRQDGAELLDLAGRRLIPLRLAKALVRDGRHTIGDLARMSRRDLWTVPDVGPHGRAIVRALLAEHGHDVARFAE